MRKRYVAVFMAILMCLAVLSGCSLLKSLERDVNVVFEVDGEYVDDVTVNIFNNAIAPEFDADGAVPEGYKFMGWSAKHDWKYGDDRDLLISSGGIVRYDAVKDWVNEGGTAVAVPIIIDKATIPRADLVIAWYSKSDTSGISEANIVAFETALRAYLAKQGYDVGDMDIVIRGYDGDVGTSCANIRKDDDVDIMLGWGGNITSTGGMVKDKDFIEHINNITVGSSSRYVTRLTDTELCNEVFIWIQNKYGPLTYKVTFNSNGGSDVSVKSVESGKTVQKPAIPTLDGYVFDGWYTDDGTFENEYDFSTPVTGDLELYAKWTEGEPTTVYTLVIGWWTDSKSGLDEPTVNKVKTAIEEYLTTKENGYKADELDIVIQKYDDGAVADVATAVNNDGNVDIMFGLKAFGDIKVESQINDVKMGTITDRRILLLKRSTSEIAVDVFNWFKDNADARALFA